MEENIKGIPILFENNICILLNKPYGLPVQGGKGVKNSLDSILTEEISPRPLLVHRLDRDTSGLILVAKNKEAARFFSALLTGGTLKKDQEIIKQYLGVCFGVPKPSQGLIKLDLENKDSQTIYRLVSSGTLTASNQGVSSLFPLQVSLLELELITGRMHQIRRHLSHIGHPLLGDDKYGDFSLNRQLRKNICLRQMLLHSSRLIIPPSPKLPKGLDVHAPLPDYFSRFLEGLTCCTHFQ